MLKLLFGVNFDKILKNICKISIIFFKICLDLSLNTKYNYMVIM